MGFPVLPSNENVRSMVRLPDSGWNTSRHSSVLDLSRSSGLAATAPVGQVPPYMRHLRDATGNTSTDANKLAEQDPLVHAQGNQFRSEVETNTTSEGEKKEVVATPAVQRAISKSAVKKTTVKRLTSKPAVRTTSTNKKSSKRAKKNMQRTNNIQVEAEENGTVDTEPQSKRPTVLAQPQNSSSQSVLPALFQLGQVVILPNAVQPAIQAVTSLGPTQGSMGQLGSQPMIGHCYVLPAAQPVFSQCNVQPPVQSTMGQSHVQSAVNPVMRENTIQQPQNRIQIKDTHSPSSIFILNGMQLQSVASGNAPHPQLVQARKYVASAITPDKISQLKMSQVGQQSCGSHITNLIREREALRAINNQLKHKLTTYQNLFKDKSRLQKIVNDIFSNNITPVH